MKDQNFSYNPRWKPRKISIDSEVETLEKRFWNDNSTNNVPKLYLRSKLFLWSSKYNDFFFSNQEQTRRCGKSNCKKIEVSFCSLHYKKN